MKVAIVFAAFVALSAAVVVMPRPPEPIFPEYKPQPEGLLTPPEVHSQVLDFPSSDNPMIRFHINVKGAAINEMHARRVARSVVGGLLLPPWILNPQGMKPLPELLPETRPAPPAPEHLPEVRPAPPAPEHLPEVLPQPEKEIEEHVFRWPDAENQLVKLKVRINENAFKPEAQVLPARSVDPVVPLPELAPTKTPDIEVFIDIGEQVKYW